MVKHLLLVIDILEKTKWARGNWIQKLDSVLCDIGIKSANGKLNAETYKSKFTICNCFIVIEQMVSLNYRTRAESQTLLY